MSPLRQHPAKSSKGTIIYDGATVKQFPVFTDGETVWLSIDQMSRLFGRDASVIGKHVRNVFSEGELDISSNRQNLPIWGKIHPVSFYSLDVVISVGYRVKSIEGTRFRQWATKCLHEILVAKLRHELSNEKIERRVDSVETRLTQVENGLAVLAEQFNAADEPFYSEDRQMIGFGAELREKQ